MNCALKISVSFVELQHVLFTGCMFIFYSQNKILKKEAVYVRCSQVKAQFFSSN